MFFKIFDAPQEASNSHCVHNNGNVNGQSNLLTQNKTKIKRQIILKRKQKLVLSQPADKEMHEPEEAGVKQDIEKAFKIADDAEMKDKQLEEEEKPAETEEETK